MGFGKKGLAAGQTAPSPGVFGARQAETAVRSAAQTLNPDEIAARRQAFLASERDRRAEAEGTLSQAPRPAPIEPTIDDPLINLRNMSRPEPRPARPAADAVEAGMGANASGMSAAQEAEIRSAARGMARNQPARYAVGARGGGGMASRSSGGSGSGYIFGDPATRNVGLAYVLWFILGQFSVHRFYCGQKDSAIMQISLWLGSLILLFVFAPIGLVGIVIWICWIVGDLFMIPGMLEKFKSEHDYRGVFA